MSYIKQALISLLAIVLIVEEWLWDVLTLFGHWISHRLHLEAFELWLARSGRWISLCAFLLPLIIVTPMNLVAFWLIAKGKIMQGILLEIVAKLLGTVLVARVFALTKRQLMTFQVLSWLYNMIMHALTWAHARVADTLVYKAAKRLRMQLRRKKPEL